MIRMDFGPGLGTWTEKQFQNAVIELAQHYKWPEHYHTHDSRGSQAGFPDLVVADPFMGSLAFLELKVGKNKPTPEQVHWIETLQACGQHAYVVYPRDIDFLQDLFSRKVYRPIHGLLEIGNGVTEGVMFNQSPENTGKSRPKRRRQRAS